MKRFCLLLLIGFASAALADEGMWTFDNFPKATVQQKYGVAIDDAWLARLQRSITRLEGGCTGSFASPEGLVLTNHHCAMGCIADLSTASDNFVDKGFNRADAPASASARAQSSRCWSAPKTSPRK
jgi:hypothetical protein